MRLGLAHVAEARVYRVIVAGDANRVDPRGHQGLLVCPIVAQSSPIVSADKLIFRVSNAAILGHAGLLSGASFAKIAIQITI